MIITTEKLRELKACSEGVAWFESQKETDLDKICTALISENHASWANWLIVRLMTHKQRVEFAIFAAEQVIHIFEEKYPEDKRPREAIEAAKNWLLNPTEQNRKVAATAARYASADGAWYAAAAAAWYAAAAAAWYAAACVGGGSSSTLAANSAYYAAWHAADGACYAAVRKEMYTKIINFGLGLLKEAA